MSILLMGSVRSGEVGEGDMTAKGEESTTTISRLQEKKDGMDTSAATADTSQSAPDPASSANMIWKGEWYFAKNQINSKEFQYRRVSDAVPKNIIDYVSFVTSSSHSGTKPRGRKKGKSRDSSEKVEVNSGGVDCTAGTDEVKLTDPTEAEAIEEPVIPQIPIPHRHPLFGLWEGSFKVSNPKGPDEEIAETFFICSFNGERTEEDPLAQFKTEAITSSTLTNLPEEFSELPPDPRWTLAYIRALQEESCPSRTTEPTTPTPDDESKEPNANDSSGFSKDIVMLVGFGCNVYGRFSLAGAYNSLAGTWRCEKKYMLSKFVGRPRKHAHSSSQSLGGDNEYMSTRNRTNSTGSLPQMDRIYDEDELSDFRLKRRRSVGSEDIERARSYESYGLDDSSFEEGTGEGDEGFRSAFYDEESGEIYEGGWIAGTRNGKGVCLYSDGTLYEGSWIGGKEHGYGVWMTGERQIIYSGEWVEGKMQGTGTYYFPNGDIYVGEWKEGLRHGKGQYTLKDGTSYSGDWRDNLRHGRGIMTWNDGSVYEGEYDRGTRHGRGELRLSDGFIYSGSWDTNYMEGRGMSIFPDGQEYQGMFKKGLREGRGSITFAEGAIYEGRFREDAMDGQGTVKITRAVPGSSPGEVLIPFEVQADIRRIHYRAGFGADSH